MEMKTLKVIFKQRSIIMGTYFGKLGKVPQTLKHMVTGTRELTHPKRRGS